MGRAENRLKKFRGRNQKGGGVRARNGRLRAESWATKKGERQTESCEWSVGRGRRKELHRRPGEL